MKRTLLVLTMLAACSSDDGGTGDGDDGVDAAPSSLRASVVTCPAQPDVTITTVGFAYSPAATTVSVGQVVAFQMPSDHDAASDDGLFSATFGRTTCVQFDAAGTYRFHCTPHRFDGAITVQ